jgi:hypothetical protein
MNAYKLPSLRELQLWMRWIITDPRGITEALSQPRPTFSDPMHRCTEPKVSCLYCIREEGALSRAERVEIYSQAYLARIVDALKGDFPTLYRSLGEEAFPSVMASYLKECPSTTKNMGEVGRLLPNFLAEFPPTREIDYLAEIALMEWKGIESFYAEECPSLDFSRLHQISESGWDTARVKLDPSVKLLRTKWPVHQLWVARDLPTFAEIEDALEPQATCLVIHRHEWNVQVSKTEVLPFWILEQLLAQKTLPQICEEILNHPSLEGQTIEKLPSLVIQAFGDWVRAGVIQSVET